MTQSAETGEIPALRTARRAGLIEQVIEQLREQIVAGTWAIGSRIPTQAGLAQLTGTSRNTVPEGGQSLVHAGLLERRQGSGTYVLAASEFAGAVGRRVATAHHVHVLEVRRTLEAGAARLAALHRTPDDVARLRGLIVERNAAARRGDVDAQIAADVAVHRAIGQAAHNPVLHELYENVFDTVSENVRSNLDLHGGADENEHVALVDAIEAQDPQRAEVEAAGFLDELLALLRAQRPTSD